MHQLLLPFLAALLCLLSTGLVSPATSQEASMDLYLLVGQSNMAGRGKLSDEDLVPHERVLTLDAKDQWRPAIDPIHFDKPTAVGVGLGRTFGLAVAKANPERTIGLIPCAVGGSPIDAWKPGVLYEPTKSHPWDDAIRRAKVAMQKGTLRGILWHQGEGDCTDELAAGYEKKLHALIKRFRDELQAPDVPFIVGQMGQFEERPWNDNTELVDQAHRQLPSHVSRTAFVSSDGLGHKGDQVHFDAAAYREFGKRYAKAYFELEEAR